MNEKKNSSLLNSDILNVKFRRSHNLIKTQSTIWNRFFLIEKTPVPFLIKYNQILDFLIQLLISWLKVYNESFFIMS